MGPDGAGKAVDFRIVGQQHAALAGGDVVREEEAEGAHMAEGAGLLAAQFGVEGLAIVLHEPKAVFVREGAYHVQRRRVAEDGNADDGPGLRRQGFLERPGVHIHGIQFDVHEPEPEPVLVQRMIGGGPGNRRHDDLVASLERPLLDVEQAGHGHQVGRRAGIDHHRVTPPVVIGESALEGRHLRAHGIAAAIHHPGDGGAFFVPPGIGRQIPKHLIRPP